MTPPAALIAAAAASPPRFCCSPIVATGPVIGPTTAILMSSALTGPAANVNASPVSDRINALCMFTPSIRPCGHVRARRAALAEARATPVSSVTSRPDETLPASRIGGSVPIDRPKSASGRVRETPRRSRARGSAPDAVADEVRRRRPTTGPGVTIRSRTGPPGG